MNDFARVDVDGREVVVTTAGKRSALRKRYDVLFARKGLAYFVRHGDSTLSIRAVRLDDGREIPDVIVSVECGKSVEIRRHRSGNSLMFVWGKGRGLFFAWGDAGTAHYSCPAGNKWVRKSWPFE